MRTRKSIINMITSICSQLIIIILGFVSRRVLIYSVGVEYLGINGLMTNILTIFSLAESGIGLTIGFSLYEPLAKNDKEKIKSLMYFYKRSYEFLAIMTAVIGIIFIPFLPMFLKGNTAPNVHIIYLLFLFSSVCSYLFSYKVTLNNSDQNKYLFTITNTITQIFILIVKMFVLYYTENYILFLAIDIFTTLIKNIVFSHMVDKRYPYLKEKNIAKLDNETKHHLFKNIKAMFIGKIGYIISQCSDNLVISSLVSIKTLGLYSNYTTVINSVSGFITIFTKSITASMGNLIVTEDNEKTFSVFKKVDFFNFWLYTFSSVCIFCLIEPFVVIWLGKQFILEKSILIVAILLYYFKGINLSVDMVKNSAGLFHPDRYVSVIEAIVNLTLSIVLAKRIGLLGVLLATLISFLFLSFWIKPYLIYTMIFGKNFSGYIIETIKKIVASFLIMILCYYISININVFSNLLINFCVKTIVIGILSNLLLIVFFCHTNEFNYIKDMIKTIICKRKYNI